MKSDMVNISILLGIYLQYDNVRVPGIYGKILCWSLPTFVHLCESAPWVGHNGLWIDLYKSGCCYWSVTTSPFVGRCELVAENLLVVLMENST